MIALPPLDVIEAEIARREAARHSDVHDHEILSSLWTPLPGPQSMAYHSLADETFYGGAPGGGKTDLALGLALTQHRSSIIFRRESTQFLGPDGIIERSRAIIGENGRLNEQLRVWRNLPGGRSLEFGSVKEEKDKNKYKGRPHDLKIFDELPDFTETQYRFLIIWLRTAVVGQRVRVLGTGNPPTTPEGQWVIRYWAPWLDPQHPNPAKPGELRWFATVEGKDAERPNGDPFWVKGDPKCRHRADDSTRKCEQCGAELVKPRSRTFIPARVEDNPYYMATGYVDVLNNLPEPLRSQMRFGNFNAVSRDHEWQLIPTAWVRLAVARGKKLRPRVPLSAVGCDPSRGGIDQFVLAKRYDNFIGRLEKHEGEHVPDGKTGARLIAKSLGPTLMREVVVGIDIIGTAGPAVYDAATDLELRVLGLNGSNKSTARDKSGKLGFINKRAEWHWHMRELLDPESGQDIALPDDPQMVSDLCAPRWKLTPRGIQVEDKLEIKKRIGRSPDAGEAVIYACAEDLQFYALAEDVLGRGEDYDIGSEPREKF